VTNITTIFIDIQFAAYMPFSFITKFYIILIKLFMILYVYSFLCIFKFIYIYVLLCSAFSY
jgi:hypothetical protein